MSGPATRFDLRIIERDGSLRRPLAEEGILVGLPPDDSSAHVDLLARPRG